MFRSRKIIYNGVLHVVGRKQEREFWLALEENTHPKANAWWREYLA